MNTPITGTTTAIFNAQGQPSLIQDRLGNTRILTHDSFGNVTREEVFDGAITLLRRTDFTYDANGNKLSGTLYRMIDGTLTPLTTQFTYDAANRVIGVVSRRADSTSANLYQQELKRSPADLGLKINVAMSALLLEANELRPFEMAREVYEKASTNAAFASTYAFALHLQGKDAEALKIMQTLSPARLEDPSIAGYYGLILKATGDGEKAKVYLNWAFKGSMLPEERKIMERARAGL